MERIKTIIFEDCGQDFLAWDVDKDGVVVACRPFQGSFWIGRKVENLADLELGPGQFVQIKGSNGDLVNINHLVKALEFED